MMKKTISIALTTFLAACGGGSENGNELSNTDLNIEDITGVYQIISDDRPGDEMYGVVRSDSSYSEFDYAGDSYDEGANCYYVDDFNLEDTGFSSFYVPSYDYDIVVRKSGNDLKVTYFYEDNGEIFEEKETFRPVDLNESDFVPEC